MRKEPSRLGSVILGFSLLGLLAVLIILFGARLGLWEPIVGFQLARTYMNPIAYSILGLGVVGCIYQLVVSNRCGAIKSAFAGLVGLALLAPVIISSVMPAQSFPPIHDITTNTNNPPAFLVLDKSRKGAKNSLVYGGAEVAEMQKKAYADIAPIQTSKTAQQAFSESLRVANEMGWEIVAQDENALRFEASARTPVFQFVDDVVVTVTTEGSASRVDIRSVSRIGRSDRGANAARIREFIETFDQ
ncbi:DUF1499 domain-containing protein [Neptunomonas phycophila]|uniref:DUF1499 domain-containing protein n=1 Tax=Neptunomonas phycophila TaxID=1572645 RepID=A0ABT9EXW9_9GAMM|nr:DUF1499 domain-containing protein [Neptunomonas phycophila]MDP2523814.1 DUF1499 domain-containing protein [Neptunomonas phycophila]